MATEIQSLIVKLQADLEEYNRDLQETGKQNKNFGKGGKESFKQVEDATQSLNKIGGRALLAFAGIAAAALSSQKIAQYAESYTNLQNKIRTVIGPTQTLEGTTADLLAVARDSRGEFESTVTLYTRLKRSTEDLNISNERLLALTTTINKSFAISGATIQESSAAITQLTQALSSDTLRGQEFNSVAEQAPIIMEALAKATGKSRGELRDLAADGAITSDVLIRSLEAYSKVVDNDFSKAQITVAQATQRVSDNFMILVGELDKATGFTKSTSDNMLILAETTLPKIQKALIQTADDMKVLGRIISEEMGAESLSTLADDYEKELKVIEDLFGSFVFLVKTGLLSIPVVAKAGVQFMIADVTREFSSARIGILEFRKFVNELLGDTDTAAVIQAQIDALGAGAADAFEATKEKIKADLEGIGTIAADFDKRMAEERLERNKERDEIELQQFREKLEKEKAIREEFEASGAGSVDIEGKPPKEKAKEEEEANKQKTNSLKKLIGWENYLTGTKEQQGETLSRIAQNAANTDKALGAQALDFAKQKASSAILVYAAEGAQKVISQLGFPGIPIAAGVLAAGALVAKKVQSIGVGDSGGFSGVNVGSAAASNPPSITTEPLGQGERVGLDVNAAGNEGISSGTLILQAAPGDSVGEALYEAINEAIRKGRIIT